MGKSDDYVLRHPAYQYCRLCSAKMPYPTAGYLRKHYRSFHLISKEPAIVTLIEMAEEEAGLDPEKPGGF